MMPLLRGVFATVTVPDATLKLTLVPWMRLMPARASVVLPPELLATMLYPGEGNDSVPALCVNGAAFPLICKVPLVSDSGLAGSNLLLLLTE